MKPLIVIFFVFFNSVATAQIYRCENDMGDINFSDEPCAQNENSTRVKWLKTPTAKNKGLSSQKNLRTKTLRSQNLRSQRTAQKAKQNNEAYVLLSLLTTTQLELETASLRSTLDNETTELPELLFSDGIIVDLLKVDEINIFYTLGKSELRLQFVMNDGYEESKIVKKPFPIISGEAKIGRFSKSLEDIKRIEFFNSEKLLISQEKNLSNNKKKIIKKNKHKEKISSDSTVTDKSPVIELDLSHEVKTEKKPSPKVKPQNVVKQTTSKVQVVFIDDRKIWLAKSSLDSAREGTKSAIAGFILSQSEHIPFAKIKSIKVRPTKDHSELVVAVSLTTGEIKMANMSKPFTRIIATSEAKVFERSLLHIKSINF